MISVQNVSFSYQEQNTQTLKDISLEIPQGSVVLVCGPTGSGKTTFIRLFNGLIPHFYEGKFQGKVTVDGINTVKVSTAKLATVVGMVFQNPDNQLISSSCEREIAFGPENLGLPKPEIKKRVESLIKLLNLESIRTRSPIHLSGGQKQKVAIASALSLNPKVLVFDEPSSNLDPTSILNLVQLLDKLNKELETTLVIVEHRLEQFMQIATHILCIENGEVVLFDEADRIIENDLFYKLDINIPIITKLFWKLKKEKKYPGLIPKTLEDGINIIKTLIKG